jgi:hypothetical protein
MKGKKLLGLIGVLIALSTVLVGCEALPSSSVETTTSSSAMAGRLQINITDAPSKPEIEQVWLTVAGVKIHLASNETVSPTTTATTTTTTATETESNDGWLSLALVGNARFNLLDYQNGLQAKLAVGDLDPGKYTQIRMDVTKVEIKLKGDPTLVEAKLPSNTLKFVHPFEIVGGQVTEILFDFDALKSINETGNGKYMCKPVIKLATTKEPKVNGNFEITTVSLPNGGLGFVYDTVTFAATGGATPYTWSISAGTIPTGLIFDGVAGTLSGTPTAAGDFTFTLKAEDSTTPVKKNATKEFTFNIAAQSTLQITTTNLPDGTEGIVYPAGIVLKAIGGTPKYNWTFNSGSNLPSGLSLDAATGIISGTPTAKGNYSFTAKVTDGTIPTVNTDTQVITIRINKAP